MAEQGWHRVMAGWYRYSNRAGKTLAEAQRYRGRWQITVHPLADPTREVELRETTSTFREARVVARFEYIALSKAALRAALARSEAGAE